MATRTLHFYTTGEGLTGLLLDFYQSGEFKKFEYILKDGNLGEEQMTEAFLLKMTLTGSTQDGGDLECHFEKESPADFGHTVYYALLTAIHSVDHSLGILDLDQEKLKNDENISTLLKYLPEEKLFSLFYKEVIEGEGFELTTLYNAITENDHTVSGLLLDSGEFIMCGFQQHINLFPVLRALNLVDGHDRLDSNALSISSSLLTGTLGYLLQSGSYSFAERNMLTDRQLEELWKLKDHKLGHYSSNYKNKSVNEEILACFTHKENLGGKFGGLAFLRKFYPDVPLVNFYKDPPEDAKTVLIRTSPRKSMPGLLTSVKATTLDELLLGVEKIIADFEIHKDVVSRNSLNWFFQDFIEGANGVVNCIAKDSSAYPTSKTMSPEYISTLKYDVRIACSDIQGNIVGGHKGDTEVSDNVATYLRRLSRRIAEDFGADIQLEFVVLPDDSVRIAQLRVLQNSPRTIFNANKEELSRAFVTGKTFSSPSHSTNLEVSLGDILIVEQDCESEKLLGKKALIVENDTNFSHILALSKALGIPSIYATGKVKLGNKAAFIFNTEYSTGYIK